MKIVIDFNFLISLHKNAFIISRQLWILSIDLSKLSKYIEYLFAFPRESLQKHFTF